ncbi:hypothetical protein ACF0H5_019728 [Mactra antiquata]
MVSFVQLLVIIALGGYGDVSAQPSDVCPNGWIRYYDSCYWVGYEQQLSFVEAEHYCRQHNGHLIHVETADENVFIVDVLHKTKAGNCWVGLSDMDTEGKWLWYGTQTTPEYTHWFPGEPGGSNNEDCAVFAAHHSDYSWDDYPCSTTQHPLCEYTPENTGIIG